MADQQINRSFDERFGIEIGTDEAQRRFINRISNTVFDNLIHRDMVDRNASRSGSTSLRRAYVDVYAGLYESASNTLGERRHDISTFDQYVGNNFLRCLRVLEALFTALDGSEFDEMLSERINGAVSVSETDLGISWQPPDFVPTGARLLDDRLVNDPLHWLSDPQYKSVHDPFEKGLFHFAESQNRPKLLADVVTDMYEAVETVAKIVTKKRNIHLATNYELFVSKVRASEHYKKLLKDYIAYANEFRHAEGNPGTRPVPSRGEVESFMYLTGVFIRLTIKEPRTSRR